MPFFIDTKLTKFRRALLHYARCHIDGNSGDFMNNTDHPPGLNGEE